TQKFSKEPPLRQQLVLHDLSHSTRSRMRLVTEIVCREFMPDGIELVYFTRIRLHDVLKRARRSSRNFIIFDSNVFVIHNPLSKRKDCRKLRPDVVRRVTRNAAKQGQQARARIRTRAVVTFLVSKRHPLVPLVLNVAGEEIAAPATQAKPPRVTRQHCVAAVVKVSVPTRIASFRIRIEDPRQWKPELNEPTLSTHRTLRRHDRNTTLQSEDDCRRAVDRCGSGGAC